MSAFQEHIPKLATVMMQHIDEALRPNINKQFAEAFEKLYQLCQESLNPNIRREAVREMLVQHLLTEQIFRTIFDTPDFTRRNVIAAEIEAVIDALTSHDFNRQDFLKNLDYFSIAIEQSAATMKTFGEKQALLNTVYERFFQCFSHKQADTHGIVYTPQEIVDFMCASVEAMLQREFGTSLSNEGVCILDPCVGMGNFIVNILHRINRHTLHHKYHHDLFCNEVMLLPYYIASLNIEHSYYERMQMYSTFPGIRCVDTLDIAQEPHRDIAPQKNRQQVERHKQANITVIIGNPPYNVGQINENDNNKNRTYDKIDERIRETYAKDSQATLNTKLYDMYVRFFRWAMDRLEGQDGIVCFVTNNGFLHGIAFDGFRKHIAQDFTHIYHLDLGGNARTKGGGNVFGIRVGVGITILVRNHSQQQQNHAPASIAYYAIDDTLSGKAKLALLDRFKQYQNVDWQVLYPDAQYTWLTHGMHAEFDDFVPMGTKAAKANQTNQAHTLFRLYSLGIATNRDEWVYDFDETHLSKKVQQFIANYNNETSRYWQHTPAPTRIDDFVNTNSDFLKWTDRLKEALRKGVRLTFEPEKIRMSLYRPYCSKFLYFDHLLNHRRYQQHSLFPIPDTEKENKVICVPGVGNRKGFGCLITNKIPNLDLAFEKTQCFPFYIYNEDGSNRRENITDWALAQFRAQCGDDVSKWDIFYYIYALLHHPGYRERYAKNLQRKLPRIPLPGIGHGSTNNSTPTDEDTKTHGFFVKREDFRMLVDDGKELADLHLHYEQAKEYPLQRIENHAVPWTWRVEKMKLSRDKNAVVVNECLTLKNIPQACFHYRLGNRSVLEWVLDQYRIKTNKRSGITSNPNRADDEEYIVRLVGQVVQVSVETAAIVERMVKR